MGYAVKLQKGGVPNLNDTPIFSDYTMNSTKTVALEKNKSYIVFGTGIWITSTGMGYVSIYKIINWVMTTLRNGMWQHTVTFNDTTGIITFRSSNSSHSAAWFVYEIITQ